MNTRTFSPPPPLPTFSLGWPAIGIVIAILVHYAVVVSFAARVEAQVKELDVRTEPLRNRGELTTRVQKLEEVTEPVRRGDLVEIQTDVRWIRERLEREARP